MLNIKTILLPLDLEQTTFPTAIVHEAAALARRFQAEVLVLHVVKPLTFIGTSDTVRELVDKAVAAEQERIQKCLGTAMGELTFKRLVVKGDPAREIARIARDERADLIVMPTHGYGPVARFLLGSVTAKVLHESECPVWTGAHVPDLADGNFAIRNVLCAIDFTPHSFKAIRWAHEAATEFGAKLTLAHATPDMEIYGPGGRHVLTDMQQELVDSAKSQIARIQEKLGLQTGTYVASGDVATVISQAAKDTGADLIVTGSRSLGRRFGTKAYGIIRESPVPVVSI